jgi:hypothetical protein
MTSNLNSFWINIISNTVFFLLTVPIVIKFLPELTIRLLRKRNQKNLTIKYSSILLELCDFISYSQYRESEIFKENLEIKTKKDNRFVAFCAINVFNKDIVRKNKTAINIYHQKLTIDESNLFFIEEHDRIKLLRIDIERILSAHSLFMNEDIISLKQNLSS